MGQEMRTHHFLQFQVEHLALSGFCRSNLGRNPDRGVAHGLLVNSQLL